LRSVSPSTYSMTSQSSPACSEDVIDTANVGMVQSGGALGFFEQAFAVGGGGVGWGAMR